MLKILNPFIVVINFCMFASQLESQRYHKTYQSYDFSKELRCF